MAYTDNSAHMRKIFNRAGLLTLANILDRFFFFILLTLIGRFLGAYAYGDFITAYVFVSISYVFLELGLTNTLIHEIAMETGEAQKYFSNMLGMRSISVPATITVIFIVVILGPFSPCIERGIVIFTCYFALMYVSHAIFGVLRAFGKIHCVAYLIMLDRGIVMLGGTLLIILKGNLAQVEAVFLLGGLARVIGGIFFSGKIVRMRFEYDWIFWKKLLIKSLPIGIFMLLALVSFRVDTLMLSWFGYDSHEVGLYNAAYNIYAIAILPAWSYAQTVFPVFSNLYRKDRKKFRHTFKWALIILAFGGVLTGWGTHQYAQPILDLAYGSDYAAASGILKILSISVIFLFLGSLCQLAFVSMGRVKFLNYMLGTTTVVNVFLNSVMIPTMASKGAAMATVMTEILFATASLIYLIKNIKT